jgi:DNA repair exonuclease SbcCD ATPase subunit
MASQTDGDASDALTALQQHIQLLRHQHRDATERLHREQEARQADHVAAEAKAREVEGRLAHAARRVEDAESQGRDASCAARAKYQLLEEECHALRHAAEEARDAKGGLARRLERAEREAQAALEALHDSDEQRRDTETALGRERAEHQAEVSRLHHDVRDATTSMAKAEREAAQARSAQAAAEEALARGERSVPLPPRRPQRSARRGRLCPRVSAV